MRSTGWNAAVSMFGNTACAEQIHAQHMVSKLVLCQSDDGWRSWQFALCDAEWLLAERLGSERLLSE